MIMIIAVFLQPVERVPMARLTDPARIADDAPAAHTLHEEHLGTLCLGSRGDAWLRGRAL